MTDPREYGPRAFEYGEVYQELVAMDVGSERHIRGESVYRVDKHFFEINDDNGQSAAGAATELVEGIDHREIPMQSPDQKKRVKCKRRCATCKRLRPVTEYTSTGGRRCAECRTVNRA